MFLYIILIILSIYFINTINNNEMSFNYYIHKTNYYIIQKDVYILGVFNHSHENTIILIVFNRYRREISINECILLNKKRKESCDFRIESYKNMDKNYYNIIIKDYHIINPSQLIINNVTMKIPKSTERKIKYKYSICVPIMYSYTPYNYLIQWFESQKLLGINKIILFYTSSNVEVKRVLIYYIKKGLLDIYKYDEQFENMWGPPSYGHVWKINHCYNLYKDKSEYIFQHDLDEIVWPEKYNSYDEMFDVYKSKDVYFIHQNLFRIDDTTSDGLRDINMLNISKTCLIRDGKCRKYVISNTSRVLQLEVHNVPYPNNLNTEFLSVEDVTLRHYRKLNKDWKSYCKSYYSHKINKKEMIIHKKYHNIKRIIFNK